jgi:hypothetical protein
MFRYRRWLNYGQFGQRKKEITLDPLRLYDPADPDSGLPDLKNPGLL